MPLAQVLTNLWLEKKQKFTSIEKIKTYLKLKFKNT